MKRYAWSLLLLALCLLFICLTACSRLPEDFQATPIDTPVPTVHEDEEVTAVMTAEELETLAYYPKLRKLDLSGSSCFDAILAYMAAHPEVEVSYTVPLTGGGEPLLVRNTDESLRLDDGSYLQSLADNAAYLPQLHSLELAGSAADSPLLETVQAAFPEAVFLYHVQILGQDYPSDTERLDLSALPSDQLDAVLSVLPRLPKLGSIELMRADGSSDLSLEDVRRISEAAPGAAVNYRFALFGQTVSTADEALEYVDVGIGNEGIEQLRQILPFMGRLQYLKLDNCQVDNEVMAQLRDDFPGIKVVWRVYFGNGYNCLTDTEMIWATGSVVDSQSGVLNYCTDVKYLDLGHNCITNINFVNYMPKLEVVILAITWVNDLSPLANCPNLEYLEAFSCRATDLSPLANCTHLQHLNVSHLVTADNLPIRQTDISSLYDLPELKRFYCTMSYVPREQQEEMIARHPDCEIDFSWEDPSKGAWRFDENGERNERYALLCEQFGYDSLQQSGKKWSLYG